MSTIKYKEDEQGNKKVIIKTDPETDTVKVSCGCCASGGCGTILGAVPPQGSSQTKPTSLAWSAAFSMEPRNVQCDTYDCSDPRELSGIITADQQCFAGVGFVSRCYADEQTIEDSGGCPGVYRATVDAQIIIGKYRKEIQSVTAVGCDVTYDSEVLVPDPEADCAYWLILSGQEQFGANGWHASLNGITGPILPENLIGSHSLECTVAAGQVVFGEDGTGTCNQIALIQRSATITIS